MERKKNISSKDDTLNSYLPKKKRALPQGECPFKCWGRELLLKCLNASDFVADDEGVDVVCSLIGEYRFKVVHMAHDWIFAADAVGAKDGAGGAGGFERHGDVVALRH